MTRRTALALSTALAAAFAAAVPGAASAQYYGDRFDRGFDDSRFHDGRFDDGSGPRWDTARVVDVQPILAPGEPVYRRQCWQEPVRFVSRERAPRGGWGYDDRYAYDDYRYGGRGGGLGPNTGTVLGGIVGAAIGNQIGDGDGRRAATVAGALLGGAIARDANRPRYDDRYGRGWGGGRDAIIEREQVRYEQRCDMVPSGAADDRVVGYRVRYDYKGFQGWTQTAHHPGNTIRVRVDVTPEG